MTTPTIRTSRRTPVMLAVAAVVLAATAFAAPAGSAPVSDRSLAADTQFYVPGFETPARQQWASLVASGDRHDADLLAAMENTSHGVWISGGTAKQARVTAQATVLQAEGKGQVPVLVAYNIPGRDCAGFSAGGATNTADYEAWIDAVASGIGAHEAVLILEPDSLGLLPSNCGGPNAAFPFTDEERYTELNDAIDRLELDPSLSVYLDATHSAWLGVGDIAQRLVNAGVQRAQGFFVNVSNYQYTPNLVQYGTWISECIATGSYGGCPNQYWNGGPDGTAIAALLGAWQGVALSPYGVWSDSSTDPALNTSGINARYAGTHPTTHFVVDTSRNGVGPWKPSASYPDAQDWCNPPGRGLGTPPTADTGNALLDAYLWVKVPGESDGSCNRGIGGSSTDPEWGGIVDPAAGQWFRQQALQLAQLANPALP